MKVLVINCGSSSLKYQLIDSDTEQVLAKGICERIKLDGSLTHQATGKEKIQIEAPMPDHSAAVKLVLQYLLDEKLGAIKNLDEIAAVGHRVVHGGEKFSSAVLINDEVLAAIEECCDLAPLHNPANLIGIRACQELMPGVPQVAVFDTAFHQTMPDYAYTYGIPYEYYEKYKVRRYGFHGATALYPSVPLNCLERISRIQRLSYVILVVARVSVQLRAESQLIRQWDLRHSKVSQWEPEVEILIQQSSNILRTKKERHSQRSSVCSTRSPVFMVSQESPVTSGI
mgnify:CR=1 FL=1